MAECGGRLTLVAGPLRRSRRASRATPGFDAARRRRARYRRLLHADRRPGARLLLPLRRPARHAHGAGRARAPPISSTRMDEGALADLIYLYGEERRSRAVARGHRRRAQARAPITTTKRLADIVASVVRAAQGRHPSRDAHLPGAAHRRERRTRRARARAGGGGARAGAGRAARRRHLPFAGGPDREALPARSAPAARPRPPATRRPSPRGRADLRRWSSRKPVVAGDAELAPIRGPARPSCASPSGRGTGAGPAGAAAEREAALMRRFLHIVAILALIGSALYAYRIKYDTHLSGRAGGQAATARSRARRRRSRCCGPSGSSSTARTASRRWPTSICRPAPGVDQPDRALAGHPACARRPSDSIGAEARGARPRRAHQHARPARPATPARPPTSRNPRAASRERPA